MKKGKEEFYEKLLEAEELASDRRSDMIFTLLMGTIIVTIVLLISFCSRAGESIKAHKAITSQLPTT